MVIQFVKKQGGDQRGSTFRAERLMEGNGLVTKPLGQASNDNENIYGYLQILSICVNKTHVFQVLKHLGALNIHLIKHLLKMDMNVVFDTCRSLPICKPHIFSANKAQVTSLNI